MKGRNIKNLIEKYEKGHSSVDEEKTILDNVRESDSELNPWFKFIKLKKTQVPEQFNEELWDKFDDKTHSKRKLIISVISAAAAVILFASLYFGGQEPQELSYEEKAELLQQAIEMTSYQKSDIAEHDIIYEDYNIIIYTKTE